MTTKELDQVTVDDVLGGGRSICSGYVPNISPGLYMEIWEYQHYIYMVTSDQSGCKLYPLGTSWLEEKQ